MEAIKNLNLRDIAIKGKVDGLDLYVFDNLAIHGNTIILKKTCKKLGVDNVLKTLKRYGFNCQFKEGNNSSSAESVHFIIEQLRGN